MKKTGMCARWGRMLLCLLVTAAMAVCLLPVGAAAASSKGPFLCLSTADGENVRNLAAGIPLDVNGVGGVLTSADLYEGENLVYVAANQNKDAFALEYTTEMCGMALFRSDATDMSSFYSNCVGAVQDSTYIMLGINKDGEFDQCTVTVTQVSTQENSDGVYEIAIEGNYSSMLSPSVIVEGDTLVAIRDGSYVFSLNQPSGGSGGGSDGGSGDSDGGGSPGRGSGGSGTPGRNTDQEKSDSGNTLYWILGGAALVVVLAVVFLKMRKPKPAPQPQFSYQPEPWPQPGPKSIGATEPWQEPAAPPKPPVSPAAPTPVRTYLEIVDGPMTGQQYPVPDGGRLLIGRCPEANIRYPADTKGVSRNHCQVFWHNGSVQVVDLGSTSGTFLQGKGQLVPNTPVPLTVGSTIYLGSKAVAIRLGTRPIR